MRKIIRTLLAGYGAKNWVVRPGVAALGNYSCIYYSMVAPVKPGNLIIFY